MVMRAVGARGRRRQAAAEHTWSRPRADGIVFGILTQRQIDRRAAAAEQAVEEAHGRDMRLTARVHRRRRRRELVEMRFGLLALAGSEPGWGQGARRFADFGLFRSWGGARCDDVRLRDKPLD